MHVIPVIDVRHGIAVRAVAGDRANYKPLDTPFAASNDPCAVARGLLAVFPFDTLYVADLDRIEGRGTNARLAAGLAAALPDVALWIDDGRASREEAGSLLVLPNVTVVIGSESIKPDDHIAMENGNGKFGDGALHHSVGEASARLILSLDFRGGEFLGPPELLANADLWPGRVIVMTLGKVGTGAGPDVATLADIAARAGPRRVYAAGGVRHVDDLRALRDAGASGALIASALHAGTIKAGDLERAAGL